jgi:putative DNA primase/helicase
MRGPRKATDTNANLDFSGYLEITPMKEKKLLKLAALKYASLGLHVFPLHTVADGRCSCKSGADCKHSGKHPLTPNGAKDATTDRKTIKAWWNRWPNANIGIATGHLSNILVIDVDGEVGKASLEQLQAEFGRLPKTVTVRTGNGRHSYFRCDGASVGNSVGKLGQGIDVRGDGGYVVAAGSAHISGNRYRFVDGRALHEAEIALAPAWLLKRVRRDSVHEIEAKKIEIDPIPETKLDRARAYADSAFHRELERVEKSPMHQRNDTLNIAAFKLGQLASYGILDAAVVMQKLAKVAREIGLDEGEIEPTIASGVNAGRRHPRRLPFSKSDPQIREVEPPQKSADEITKELSRLGETDTDNAQRFAKRFGGKALYTAGRGWLVFDGKRWRGDNVGQVMELAKKAARLIADESRYLESDTARAERSRFAKQSLSKGSLDRMIDLAKGLQAVEDARLDANPWLLNVTNGTIDLKTGRRERHDPRDLLTKIAPVKANRHADCPEFDQFLNRIAGGDTDLAAFIQTAVGYTLTGVTTEQVLFFVYGKGNNGKSTLVNLIREMLGDYGLHTPTETLLVKQYDNAIPADLARLDGARMVTAVEANFNRHLDEARIKAMTGGEPITARFMRQNFFQFVPVFKLWLVANDQPRARGTDHAFWRRVRVIPLTVQIPETERDPNLSAKLRGEWPGILAWAVRGCLKWQKSGLGMPDVVESATKGWQKEMDHLKTFASDQLESATGLKIAASTLYDRYKNWCVQHGEQSLTVQEFKTKLTALLDITHTRTKGRSWWRNIRFRD